jgi:hypothetical protein
MARGLDSDVDCTPFGAEIVKAGYGFVCRYADPTKDNPLTRAEALHLSGLGLHIVTISESGSPTDAGYFYMQKGIEVAAAILARVQAIGQPTGTPIYFSVDFDASGSDLIGPITNYFSGVRTVLDGHYLTGVYGSGFVCQQLKSAGLVHFTWLAESTGWRDSAGYEGWNICQNLESVGISGLSADSDVSKGDGGGWRITA